ncbi:MAG: pantetheine-phosphate adenylyltransferase [Bacteriovoracaceae bacterium]|nr:pantetheine-phosphate adenylyltransferase [Bacteriovoracaceae bacterium]
MKKAIYAGTFDLFTNGHLEIVNRSLEIFDEMILVVASSEAKKTMFSMEHRVSMLNNLFENSPKVCVDSWNGLIVDYAREKKVTTVVRGLRPTGDFENEFQMASMNRQLFPQMETIFLMTSNEVYYISSGLVKEIWSRGGDISKFVPGVILNYISKSSGGNDESKC